MQEPGFWDDIKRAEELTKESKFLKSKLERFNAIETKIEDIEVLNEIMEENDEESINEIISTVKFLEKEIEDYKIEDAFIR